jgi:hypothetical protein
MMRISVPALCALSAVALGACSQQNAEFLPGGSTGPAPNAAASVPTAPLPAAAERASTLIGLPVESRAGQPLGTVQDIVFGSDGRATHLIVAPASGSSASTLTPVPWSVALRHLHGGALVFKRHRFAGAPGFAPHQWPALASADWSATADAYWSRTAGHPVTPVDPTGRSRARPSMPL